MKPHRIIFVLASLASLATAPLAVAHGCASASASVHPASMKADLVAVAAGNEDFSTLVAAVQAAGLVETLQGSGPFTIFAPTNAAFAQLPEGTLASLLKPENKEQLVSILAYHVVPAKVLAADVTPGHAPTVNGAPISLSVNYGNVKVNQAHVIATDVMASNGVIHVIDQVILPPAT